eukprot:8079952-Prorocentrum_lima.AAC.1
MALSCIRRIADQDERTSHPTYMLLLDWKQAFDKVTHPALLISLRRIGASPKLIRLIALLYRHPRFCVLMQGVASDFHVQQAGIRQ